MSLSTLLEAAKYLDYLDSNNHNQSQLQFLSSQPQQQGNKRQSSSRRQRSNSRKNAANTMVAMSLPASTGPIQMQGVPIPVGPPGSNHQAASLSSSFTTGSPLSSFASTALFCSKASGVTSDSSSASSSLSSSDSSSSCGEILMGDNDFNQSPVAGSSKTKHSKQLHKNSNNNSSNHHNYHLTHQQFETNHQIGSQTKPSIDELNTSIGGRSMGCNNQSTARYIAATSAGPQLVTMTTSSAASSAPADGILRTGHVIHAANNSTFMSTTTGSSFDPRHPFSMATAIDKQPTTSGHHDARAFNVTGASSFGCDTLLSSSPGSCPPLIMARVQPMILNSFSPSTQSLIAFQPATASSPTSSSSSYSRHRELHKTLEKNRRAHLRHCFELLKAELPASECVDRKTSHINIIKSAIRYVLALRQQECEIDNELQRLTKIKSELTENLSRQPLDNNQSVRNQHLLSAPPSEPQQPVAEQQLSFLLSQSKID